MRRLAGAEVAVAVVEGHGRGTQVVADERDQAVAFLAAEEVFEDV